MRSVPSEKEPKADKKPQVIRNQQHAPCSRKAHALMWSEKCSRPWLLSSQQVRAATCQGHLAISTLFEVYMACMEKNQSPCF